MGRSNGVSPAQRRTLGRLTGLPELRYPYPLLFEREAPALL